MRHFSIFRKILPLVMIASLLSLPIAGIIKSSVHTSFENALVETSFMANDDRISDGYFLKTELKISFNVELIPTEELRLHGNSLWSTAKPAMAMLSPKDIISEIFIPPRIVS